MNNAAILTAGLVLCGGSVGAESCENRPGSDDNCVRVLACIGEAGLWFDGQATGWNEGSIAGHTSDGSACMGRWTADGPLGFGLGEIACDSGLEAQVLYHTQDDETGTVTGTGKDNLGRAVRAWSGANVLEFLTPSGEVSARLPCSAAEIPLS